MDLADDTPEDLREEKLELLRAEVTVCEQRLAEARAAHERDDVEPRAKSMQRMMERRFYEALSDLATARGRLRLEEREVQKIRDARELRGKREPPSLQALVETHAYWDQVPQAAWDRFNAAMTEWKAKMRNGEFGAGATDTIADETMEMEGGFDGDDGGNNSD
jgi:hypothetical protein